MNNGPFATEREARAAAHEVVSPEPGWSILRRDGNRDLLCRALGEAGVSISAYEGRIAAWLTGWEDSTVAVIAGWIARANRAGSEDQAAGDDERCCQDCDGNPHHLAGGCQDAAERGQR